MERITVVGMGPLGTSLGLALKNIRLKNTEVVGHFLNRRTQSEVKKMDAFDLIEGNLDKAVNGAQLVVIDSPINETRDLFETLGSIVSDGAVITDMGSSKKRSAAWAEEFLPNTASYVGGRPIIKAELNGVESASVKLFEGVNYCVIPSKSANDQATKTVVGLAESVGAKPYFLDVDEHDSYSAAMNNLPYLISTAFVNATAACHSSHSYAQLWIGISHCRVVFCVPYRSFIDRLRAAAPPQVLPGVPRGHGQGRGRRGAPAAPEPPGPALGQPQGGHIPSPSSLARKPGRLPVRARDSP